MTVWRSCSWDGGSSDGTLEIASRYGRVRTIGQIGTGLPDAWNCGIAAACGELIAFLDGDDVWAPEKPTVPGVHPGDRPSRRLRDHEDAVRARAGPPQPSRLQTAAARVRPPRTDAELTARTPHRLRPNRHLRHALADRERHRLVRPAKDSRLCIEVVPDVLVEKRVHDAEFSTLAGSQINRWSRRAPARVRGATTASAMRATPATRVSRC